MGSYKQWTRGPGDPGTGWYKTWTLDSGLDYGLDYGQDYGLDFGLDSKLNLCFQAFLLSRT